MEANANLQRVFFQELQQFIKTLNELNKKHARWLAFDIERPLKKNFVASVESSLETSEVFFSRHKNLEPRFSEAVELSEIINDLTTFNNSTIGPGVQITRSLINYFSADLKEPEKDISVAVEYLQAFQQLQSVTRQFIPDLENIIKSKSKKTSPASKRTESITRDIPPISTSQKKAAETPEDKPAMSEEEQADIAKRFISRFYEDFNALIQKHIKWYSETYDDKDRELGRAVASALERAGKINEMSPAFMKEHSKEKDNEFDLFNRDVKTIAPVCRDLLDHYKKTLTPEQYDSDSIPLQEFLVLAEKYEDALKEAEEYDGDDVPPSFLKIINEKAAASHVPAPEEIITHIKSDVPDAEAEDSLDITPDVNALASVITYSKVTPPLAIGLFGNWGSGKSFFMKKLRKQIDVFAADNSTEYVNRVVHIEFNSWHYSDSNLWASFVTKIFEDLDSYGKSHPDDVKELFKKLNSASEFLTEANTRLEGIKATIVKLENELEEKKTEIAVKSKKLSGKKLTDVAAKVLSNPDIKTELEKIRKQLPQKELKSLSDIQRSIKELDGFWNKFVETLKLLLSFKTWKSWVALALFILILTSGYWLFPVFGVHISNLFGIFGKYANLAAVVLTPLAGIATYATAGLNKVQEKLKSVAGSCTELEKEVMAQYQSEADVIQAELDMQKEAHIQKEAEINKLKKEQAEVQAAIEDIQSGKKLANFIAGRVSDQRYINSLGLISWIRKDFQKLDVLLKEQRVANLEKLSKLPKEEKEKIFQIDRIVLYIDDLDRCNEEVVVKVLEAIHLLLAFELFVVVVGVDPRWMHNALENRYSRQLKKSRDKIFSPQEAEAKENGNTIDSATSYDYLEKIFQIPLSLNEINAAGKAKLIDETLRVTEQTVADPVKEKKKPEDAGVPGQNGAEGIKEPSEKPAQVIAAEPGKIKQELKEKERKENEKEIKRAKQRLVISAEEINFMKAISSLIGNSPRAVNRYINIYRILRSHRNQKLSDSPLQDYCAVMVLLGIITGLPNESEEFFRLLARENSGTFGSFVEKQGDKFKTLNEACTVKFKVAGQFDKTAGGLTVDFMKQKFELVQRFSFRSYCDNEVIPNADLPFGTGLQKKHAAKK